MMLVKKLHSEFRKIHMLAEQYQMRLRVDVDPVGFNMVFTDRSQTVYNSSGVLTSSALLSPAEIEQDGELAINTKCLRAIRELEIKRHNRANAKVG